MNGLYPEAYGCWAGNPCGVATDLNLCCERVWGREVWSHGHQCQRPRGFGPDKAYCKQHDPAAKAARRKKSDEAYALKFNKERYGWLGRQFFSVLQQIADGHNDARGLAKETIDEFLKGARTTPEVTE